MDSKGDLLKEGESSKSINVGIHRPKKDSLKADDINLGQYGDIPLEKIYLDPKPRIRNIVKELEEEHQWIWPPPPTRDYELIRATKRKKWEILYTKQCFWFCTILSLVVGSLELLVAFGFAILPKTFIPAMRESSEFCILFTLVFVIEGFFHIYAGILCLGLRKIEAYKIGFAFPSWPFEFVLPLLGLFAVFISFYTTQRWRLLREMNVHLKTYSFRWYSQSHWDHYQTFMLCCGIDGKEDWANHAALLFVDGKQAKIPKSCCSEDNCWNNPTADNVRSSGCLDMTIMGTNAIFGVATICMIFALILSMLGYKSMREAEDFIGDPIHVLLFDTNTSTSSLKKQNKAARREELFSMLTQYSIIHGEEQGFTDEVQAVKDYLGADGIPKPEMEERGEGVYSPDQTSPAEAFERGRDSLNYDLFQGARGGSTTDLIVEKLSPTAPAETQLLLKEEEDLAKAAKVKKKKAAEIAAKEAEEKATKAAKDAKEKAAKEAEEKAVKEPEAPIKETEEIPPPNKDINSQSTNNPSNPPSTVGLSTTSTIQDFPAD